MATSLGTLVPMKIALYTSKNKLKNIPHVGNEGVKFIDESTLFWMNN